MSNLTGEISPLQSKILGTWNYVATSAHGTERQGSAEISEDHGQICVSGNFEDKGKASGRWSSEMARIELQQLNVLYRLEDFRDEGTTSSMAVLSVAHQPVGSQEDVGKLGRFGQRLPRRHHLLASAEVSAAADLQSALRCRA